jgi:hypothetical protein
MTVDELKEAILHNHSDAAFDMWEQSMQLAVPDNEYLEQILDQFIETRSKYPAPILCLYETLATDQGKVVGSQSEKVRINASSRVNTNSESKKVNLVRRGSACLDPGEGVEKYPLERNHFNLNKFSKPTDEGYRRVSRAIEKMASGASELLAKRLQHQPKC